MSVGGAYQLEVPIALSGNSVTPPQDGLPSLTSSGVYHPLRALCPHPGWCAPVSHHDDLTKETAPQSLDKDPNPCSPKQYLDYLDYLDQNIQVMHSSKTPILISSSARRVLRRSTTCSARLDLDALSYELRHRASTDGSA